MKNKNEFGEMFEEMFSGMPLWFRSLFFVMPILVLGTAAFGIWAIYKLVTHITG